MNDLAKYWHHRFTQQLGWTSNARNYIYRKLDFMAKETFLEIGCGTGALLEEVTRRFIMPRIKNGKKAEMHALDKDREFLQQARKNLNRVNDDVKFYLGNANSLPLDDNSMDIIFCQYFLMWNDDDEQDRILNEVMRVLKPGGWFICFAEPDYSNIIDIPENAIVDLFINSLMKAGANLEAKKFIERIFKSFKAVHVKNISKPWKSKEWKTHFDDEWSFFHEVLVKENIIDEKTFLQLKLKDVEFIKNEKKCTYLPVYAAFGRKSLVTRK
ncbi:MAG: class I SAM-dependent methyltransferase [Promethearchaeota archaeon]